MKYLPRRTRWIPATEWNKHHDWPTLGALRHYIFFAKTNGFFKCVRRVGRRVLIDEQAFYQWVESGGAS